MLLPTPQTLKTRAGALPLSGLTLAVDARLMLDAGVCAALSFLPTGEPAAVTVTLDPSLPPEGYALVCGPDGCRMTAADAAGAVHALVALSRLGEGGDIPFCEISDAPTYAWRGLHIDPCRHFFPLSTLKKLVDLAALYRLNRLHLHLSDDQGFRFESLKFPLLNTVGSWRSSSAVRDGRGERQDNAPHGGYYTQTELRELVAYAHARAVEIVPEIDIPGHANAMLAAYPHLSCTGEQAEVVTEYGVKAFSARILCAGNPDTLPFLCALLDEVMDVFPFPYLHLGGDEAVKTAWQACPKCQRRRRELGLPDERALQGYLLAQCAAHVTSRGRRAIIWNDGLSGQIPRDTVVQHWMPAAVEGMRRTKAHLAAGGQAIMSPFLRYYFDYPYAITPLFKTMRYVPAHDAGGLLGVECCLWTEWIATEEKLFFQLLPRLAAFAQTAWRGACGRELLVALPDEYRLYDRLGLPYNRNAVRRQGPLRRLRVAAAFARTDTDTELRQGTHSPSHPEADIRPCPK